MLNLDHFGPTFGTLFQITATMKSIFFSVFYHENKWIVVLNEYSMRSVFHSHYYPTTCFIEKKTENIWAFIWPSFISMDNPFLPGILCARSEFYQFWQMRCPKVSFPFQNLRFCECWYRRILFGFLYAAVSERTPNKCTSRIFVFRSTHAWVVTYTVRFQKHTKQFLWRIYAFTRHEQYDNCKSIHSSV